MYVAPGLSPKRLALIHAPDATCVRVWRDPDRRNRGSEFVARGTGPDGVPIEGRGPNSRAAWMGLYMAVAPTITPAD